MTIDIEIATAAMPCVEKDTQRQGFLRSLMTALRSYLEKRRTRRDLADLTDDELRDVGVTRAETHAEINKSWFWS